MPVLVTGATGCVGRALVPRLLDAGGQVRVYVRRDVPEYRALGVKVAIGDADHEGRLESALEQVHTLIHLVGGPMPERGVTVEWLNLETTEVALRAAENAEVRRVLFLSPMGADPSSDNAYLSAKGRAEQAIAASKLEYAIFRSAPILGEGSALSSMLTRGIPSRVRDAKLNPIAVEDVAAALVAGDTRDEEVRGSWELGGPEVVTLKELAGRSGSRSGILSRSPQALVDLYGRDAVADPTKAVAQFGLRLIRLDEAIEGPGGENVTGDATVEKLGRGFPTPEEAAIASFPESAGAYVIRLEYSYNPSIAYVIVDTEPSHTMRVSCLHRGDLWYEIGDIVE
jgi:NADH dehydrogenase